MKVLPRSFVLALAASALAPAATGQFGPQQVISTQADSVQAVFAADIDGDGDVDVLSASRGDDKVAWYLNLGGGPVWPEVVITTQANHAGRVFAIDLDGDGDVDVLSGSDDLAWHENLGGGSFGPMQVITTQVNGAVAVHASDLDGDGDADVLSASLFDDKVAWYENLGGGSFGSQQVITTQADGAVAVYASDLDGDGDADVLSASQFDDKIAWYENLGGGSFGTQQAISTLADGASSVYATDLDGDGDADVLSASSETTGSKIAWYENLGGGFFGPQQIITSQGGAAVYATDFDGDGDADVLSALAGPNTISWHENLGGGSFGPDQIIVQGAEIDGVTGVYAADIDGDGDADVLSSSQLNDTVAWYENLMGGPGAGYCTPAIANSTGLPGVITATGTALVINNDLTLTADQLPPNQFGYFLNSQTQANTFPVPNSQGALCVGGAIGRYNANVFNTGAMGTGSLQLDLASTPTPTGTVAIQSGETWNFTAWFRDLNPTQTSNFTDGVSVTFN